MHREFSNLRGNNINKKTPLQRGFLEVRSAKVLILQLLVNHLQIFGLQRAHNLA